MRSLEDWLEYQQRIHPRGIALGLERVRDVAARLALGRPARQVLTVAGTNGKGSTVAMLDAALRAAGRRTARYTSPHVLRYNERIALDGVPVGDAAIVAAFERIEAVRGATPLTYFEFGTLAALLIFAEAAPDVAVLEVGMGGRLDAVNWVDADVAAITTVDLDHQEYLGPDREAIGFEKAGVMRAGRVVVLGEREPPASVLAHARAIGALPLRRGVDFELVPRAGGGWRYLAPGLAALELPPLALAAPCQSDNAATALTALRALDAALDPIVLARGVAAAVAPARLQRVGLAPEVVLDVGHNPQAARELARWLGAAPARRTLAVFAALGDKDHAGIVQPLAAMIARWHVAGLEREVMRGIDGASTAARVTATLGRDAAVRAHADVATALGAALGEATSADRVLVFGSFYTVAAALRALPETAPGTPL